MPRYKNAFRLTEECPACKKVRRMYYYKKIDESLCASCLKIRKNEDKKLESNITNVILKEEKIDSYEKLKKWVDNN